MEKLKFFTFNNLRWQYRKFDYAELANRAGYKPLLETWLEPFQASPFDTVKLLKSRLGQMIGQDASGANLRMLADLFVDAEGVAWQEDSFAVFDNENMTICLVSPKPRV